MAWCLPSGACADQAILSAHGWAVSPVVVAHRRRSATTLAAARAAPWRAPRAAPTLGPMAGDAGAGPRGGGFGCGEAFFSPPAGYARGGGAVRCWDCWWPPRGGLCWPP